MPSTLEDFLKIRKGLTEKMDSIRSELAVVNTAIASIKAVRQKPQVSGNDGTPETKSNGADISADSVLKDIETAVAQYTGIITPPNIWSVLGFRHDRSSVRKGLDYLVTKGVLVVKERGKGRKSTTYERKGDALI